DRSPHRTGDRGSRHGPSGTRCRRGRHSPHARRTSTCRTRPLTIRRYRTSPVSITRLRRKPGTERNWHSARSTTPATATSHLATPSAEGGGSAGGGQGAGDRSAGDHGGQVSAVAGGAKPSSDLQAEGCLSGGVRHGVRGQLPAEEGGLDPGGRQGHPGVAA